ncbi:MAG: hypothetical protein KDK26_18820 [Roseivivax sp.]|nr:hypothetical protein [Roseivivax sp.]
MTEQKKIEAEAQANIPVDFVYDTEHPVLPVPFTLSIGEQKFQGTGLSITAAFVKAPGQFDPALLGTRFVTKLQFDFDGFTVAIYPECQVAGTRDGDEIALQFIDPTGPHLPQLRYILNSYIAGDFVTMGAMLGYTGPTKPKAPKEKAAEDPRRRLKSLGTAVLSGVLILAAANVLVTRYVTKFEPRPVIVERAGTEMRATAAGQVAYLNANARQGEVVFTINSNSGDVLNFQLPCDCQIALADGLVEGATVLPIDPILTFFDNTVGVRVRTQMSVEGLAKAMDGERVYLDMADGRSVPVRVVVSSATNASALRGELYVPVDLVAEEGALGPADIGQTARVRLAKPILGGALLDLKEML